MRLISKSMLWTLLVVSAGTAVACSGGSFVGPSSAGSGTTIKGTTIVAGSPGSGGALAASAPADLKVCLKGTTKCADVNADGTFELTGEFDGDVTLQFISAQGTVTLTIEDVRPGETIVVTVTINGTTGTLKIESREDADSDDESGDNESDDDESDDDDDESEDDDDESEDDESEAKSGTKS